ncbi:hypothetical protein ACFPVX_14105 [Cohnella faecalis]|uniref:Butirosin biosynthesis protein H N-terminal domain-containing protein n=1 Tax=Cohnella faecalis TaxID=2315694 RepID=A0A398CHV2_9BACL|nr:hypothetical protein [Cohnella faecalis]RIE02373.1 hypothetical protein D3H35_16800 [Cohnella faecalis]
MQVSNFKPTLEIPFYYPCNLPLIHEVLKRQGSTSSLSLVANSRFYGLPAYCSTGHIRWYFNRLEYDDPIWTMTEKVEFSSFEEGLDRIRQRTNEEEMFLVTGTSYFLPYCEDYLNPKYIEKLTEPNSRLYLVDHWLAVYGIEDDHVLVYDPVPSRYSGPLSMQAFHDFWKGNKSIPELADAKRKEELFSYSSLDVKAKRQLTPELYKEELLRTLATHSYEFLSGTELKEGDRTYYFGHAVTLQLLKRIHLTTTADDAAGSVSGFLFDMRWSRYFFRDLLQDVASSHGSVYVSIAAEFSEIIEQWEKAHKMLKLYEVKNKSKAELASMLGSFVTSLSEREYRLYERIWSETRNVGLFDKRHAQEDGSSAKQKEALERIVLESCLEINRFHDGRIPVELGLRAPLYGRNGNLDSLGLVSLLTVVEHGIMEELGIGLTLSEEQSPALPDGPFRTVESFVDFILDRMPEAV